MCVGQTDICLTAVAVYMTIQNAFHCKYALPALDLEGTGYRQMEM